MTPRKLVRKMVQPAAWPYPTWRRRRRGQRKRGQGRKLGAADEKIQREKKEGKYEKEEKEKCKVVRH